MKRMCRALPLLLALSLCAPMPSMAAGGTTWAVTGNTLTVSGTGATGKCPGDINLGGVTELVIGPGITEISAGAFAGLAQLTTAKLPDGLTDIQDRAFQDCANLVLPDRTLPDSVTHIGLSAFKGCKTLDLVRLPAATGTDGLALEAGAFLNTDLHSLTEIGHVYTRQLTVNQNGYAREEDTEGIPPWCFAETNLHQVTLHSRTVHEFAFSGCAQLTTVTMARVNYLGRRAFGNCVNLAVAEIPAAEMRGEVFYGCKGITATQLPTSVVSTWRADNFIAAGWGLEVEIYVQGVDGAYALRNTVALPGRAFWTMTASAANGQPEIRLRWDETTNFGTTGDQIQADMTGEDLLFTAQELGPLPEAPYKLREIEQTSFVLTPSASAQPVRLYYQLTEAERPEPEVVTDTATTTKLGTLTIQVEPANSGAVEELTAATNRVRAYRITPTGCHTVTDVTVDGKVLGPVTEFSAPNDGKDHTAYIRFNCPGLEFEDIATAAWYHDAVDHMIKAKYMIGTGAYVAYDINQDGKIEAGPAFEPELGMTRAQLALLMYNIAGATATREGRYNDTPDGAWYNPGVNWATDTDLVIGYGDGYFGPEDLITREQFITLLYRAAGTPEWNLEAAEGYDLTDVSEYAVPAVCWAIQNGCLKGDDYGDLQPKGVLTRAQAAALICRVNGW